MSEDDGDLWVFGYGSLIWNPGFSFLQREPATIRGYHRALCIFSHVHRGTPERPGLVFGLDRGGACRGIAYRVPAAERSATIDYLRKREQVTLIYKEALVRARLADGSDISAITCVVDRSHTQYAGRLAMTELVRLTRQGIGVSGVNADYVRSTNDHLVALGIRDPVLQHLVDCLDEAVAD